jgi:hypothetical protein
MGITKQQCFALDNSPQHLVQIAGFNWLLFCCSLGSVPKLTLFHLAQTILITFLIESQHAFLHVSQA